MEQREDIEVGPGNGTRPGYLGMTVRAVLEEAAPGAELTVHGWVRTRRDSKGITFIELNDGSCRAGLQVVADKDLPGYPGVLRGIATGHALRVRGGLVPSPGRGQAVELRAREVEVLGEADPASYPLQKKRHGFEFLRTITHLRPRTNALAAVARIRSRLCLAVHEFLARRDFFQVHTPVITTSDCEGAGEMFTVTALEPGQLAQGEHGPDQDPFARDFFGRRAGLTVSGQLQAEVYAQALGRVYTFGPAFRAENSNTTRHLAEFWMIEPEMAFCTLEEDMALAEDLIQHLARVVMEDCARDLDLFARFVDKGLMARLESVTARPFVRMSYTEAVERLAASGEDFEYPPRWGADLHAEHERWLCAEADGPVVVTDYPAAIKPFYMYRNDDGRTVAAMDILVPGIGELVGGSQREHRLHVLEEAMRQAGLDLEEYAWYLDLRRYGTCPRAGFGLGFERLVQFVTGMGNIRDVIPFPRAPGLAPC